MANAAAPAASDSPNRLAAYETSGAAKLAKTPSKPRKRRGKENTTEWGVLKNHLEARLNMLRAYRFSWMEHYQLLESYILPRRGIFINPSLPTANTMIRGMPINQTIVDPTGTQAMHRCSAGLMQGSASPSRPWFKLKPALVPRELADAAALAWFEEVEDRMYVILGRSNFYEAMAQQYEDLVTFGTGPMIIYEDEQDVIRCYVPCCGEYFIASSSANRVEPLYRLFVMTTSAIVEMFGLENCPPEVQQMWREKGGQLEVERVVAHSIEPNFEIANGTFGDIGVIPGDFTWREVYWLYGASSEYPLSMRGFTDQPHVVPRWATTSNDAYGRSVGMDVLPDIMQLQVMTRRLAEAIEKQVRPPMLASMELKNEPSSQLPGHLTYVNSLSAEKGMRPIFTVTPEIKEMMENMKEIQLRIKTGFFNDLFMMLEGQTKDMTAYEVAQRTQEKMQVLGPVTERIQNEDLGPKIKRVFRVMERKGLLPPLPDSLKGVPLGIEYIGMLTIAQRATATGALERFAATMGNMQAADPTVSDLWDRDEWTHEFADNLFLSKKILNPPEKVAMIRQNRAKQQQQQQAVQTGMAAVQGATALSNMDVGGGQNALQKMLGGAPAAGNA